MSVPVVGVVGLSTKLALMVGLVAVEVETLRTRVAVDTQVRATLAARVRLLHPRSVAAVVEAALVPGLQVLAPRVVMEGLLHLTPSLIPPCPTRVVAEAGQLVELRGQVEQTLEAVQPITPRQGMALQTRVAVAVAVALHLVPAV